jgi:hypothetical protein
MLNRRSVRRFLQHRRGIIEAYAARWTGGGMLCESFQVRIDHYLGRSELAAENLSLDTNGDWHPFRSTSRPLTAAEWERVSDWVDDVQFWELPGSDRAHGVLDGDRWTIEGYCGKRYHSVSRHTGSRLAGTGAGVYQFGRRLAVLAGILRDDYGEV